MLAATLRGMEALGLLDGSNRSIAERCPELTSTGFAHLRIGLRTLAQAAWLGSNATASPATTRLTWTRDGIEVARFHGLYVRLGDYLAQFSDSETDVWSRPWSVEQERYFGELVDLAERRWNLDIAYTALRDQTIAHLDGALLTPLLLSLQAQNRLGSDRPSLPDSRLGQQQRRLFLALGLIGKGDEWTPVGAAGLGFSGHLGLCGSYLPLLAQLPDLYSTGFCSVPVPDGREWHVQRALNIRASTAAHGRYFADADALIRGIFDRAPLAAQPAFVLDVGCGDGTWLARIDRLVRESTLRGRHLDDYPLRIVGADFAISSIDQAQRSLAAADALVLRGDVTDPDALRDALAEHGLNMADGLHVHAFVDHNRTYRGGGDAWPDRPADGCYLSANGEALTSGEVERDLTGHFARWAPYLERHGLVTLEAHCVAPRVTTRNLGLLHSIAFDAYHAYSRQYPIEHGAYIDAARRAGLRRSATGGRCYPASRSFVAVSLDHLLAGDAAALFPRAGVAPRADTWVPEGVWDYDDGNALHALLYEGSDLRHPRSWCALPTRRMVTRAMEILTVRLERLPFGGTMRICDYGTGTGLAAIELLKACRECGFDSRLQQHNASLELHLVDIPSPWFAQGHRLLGAHPWTRFHSLTKDGGFRPLREVVGGQGMDLILSSMVFHLIRPGPFERVARELANALSPGGSVLWNAPDLAPADPSSVLFHDPNRMLRHRWKALLSGAVIPMTDIERQATEDAANAIVDDARANRRILAHPNRADAVASVLAKHLEGSWQTGRYEMTGRETLDAICVPSNHREFLPEISRDNLRLAFITELMTAQILPALHNGPAGTGLGHSIQWTWGESFAQA